MQIVLGVGGFVTTKLLPITANHAAHAAAQSNATALAAFQLLQTITSYVVHAAEATLIALERVLEILQIAAQQAGTTQALLVQIAEQSKDIAMDVTGQANINVSIKVHAPQVKLSLEDRAETAVL